jgi:hypothetical protein
MSEGPECRSGAEGPLLSLSIRFAADTPVEVARPLESGEASTGEPASA